LAVAHEIVTACEFGRPGVIEHAPIQRGGAFRRMRFFRSKTKGVEAKSRRMKRERTKKY
jgi:hypothetical protein